MNVFSFLLDGTASGDAAGGLDMTWIWIVFIAAMALFIFFGYRRNKKEEREYNNMRDSLMVGDEVTTIGGIIGKIVSIKDETFVLETTKDRTKIRFLKGAIKRVDVKIADVAAEAAAPKAEEKTEVKADDVPLLQVEDDKPAETKSKKTRAKAEKKADKETETAKSTEGDAK